MSASSKAGLLAVCGSFTGLCSIVVGLRFYARKLQKLPLMADDWITVPALLYFAIGVLTTFTLAFTKLSALFFYRRVFCAGHGVRWFNIATITTIVIVACWLVAIQLIAGLECGTHFSALWDGNYGKYCTYSFAYLYALAVSDFLLDVWILVLPVFIIIRLHMNLSRKLSLIGLFLLAFVGLGASIARMRQYIEVEIGGDPALFDDLERTDTEANYYSMLEAGISLFAVNLPSLWLFFTTLLPDQIVRSVRSMISLPSLSSQQRAGLENADASAINFRPKLDPSSSIDSGHPDIPSDLSELRHHRQMDWQKLSGNSGSQKAEAIAMHSPYSKEQNEAKMKASQGEIYVESVVELSREELQKTGDEFC